KPSAQAAEQKVDWATTMDISYICALRPKPAGGAGGMGLGLEQQPPPNAFLPVGKVLVLYIMLNQLDKLLRTGVFVDVAQLPEGKVPPRAYSFYRSLGFVPEFIPDKGFPLVLRITDPSAATDALARFRMMYMPRPSVKQLRSLLTEIQRYNQPG